MALQPLLHSTRNKVFTALFQLVQTIPAPNGSQTWGTITQTIRDVDAYASNSQQPVLTLARGPQKFKLIFPGGTRFEWKVFLLIYFRTDGFQTANTYPDEITDPIIDSIEQLFTPVGNNQYFTLGGVCQNCWIDGMIVADPAISDNQAVIFCPITIVV